MCVTEGAASNSSNEERLSNAAKILSFSKDCNFDLYTCCLEYGIAESPNQIQILHNSCEIDRSAEYQAQLKELLASAKNATVQEDLILRLKTRLFNLAAKKTNHEKVLVGTTGTRLAGQLLAAVGEGRGDQIADFVVSCVLT